MNFYLTELPDDASGFVCNSAANAWEGWVGACLPEGLHQEMRTRLISNLKHILVGLELKAALVVPHANRGAKHSLLFEPYFHIMNFEFCVGVFSLCEGIGSAIWLRENGHDGSAANRVAPNEWKPLLVNAFDPKGEFSLNEKVDCVQGVRDKLHQDRLGARESIDWHAFSYKAAFLPALGALQCLLQKGDQRIPEETNLRGT